MFGPKFSVAKCKTASGLVVGRLKLLKNKKSIQIKQMKREISELLHAGKNDNAVIRCEAVIHHEKMIAGFEILELFCELLNVRLQLIDKTKEIPSDMREAVASIIFAARRVPEVPEIGQLSQQLGIKYGKEFAAAAAGEETCRNVQVNEKLIECLSVNPPPGTAKLDLLAEVAKEYSVDSWDYELARRQLVPDGSVPSGLMTGPPPSNYVNFTGDNDKGSGGNDGGGGAMFSAPAQRHSAPRAQPKPSHSSYHDAQSAADAAAKYSASAAEAASAAARYAQSRDDAEGHNAVSAAPMWPPPPTTRPHKTDEEIQREYDAATGPPTKEKHAAPAAAPDPPSAPYAVVDGSDGALPDPPSTQPHQSYDLPHPPSQQPGGAPELPRIPPHGPQSSTPATMDELDELTKRFEALKKT